MPMIAPTDVREYTSFQTVKDRIDTQLDYDIIQAEQDVISYCGHDFSDTTAYPTLPKEVKLALIKLAEYYALVNADESLVKGIKSEKLGDYSYTFDGEVKKFSLSTLLRKYVSASGRKGTTFKMRSL